MNVSDLDYHLPENLIAIEPIRPSRILSVSPTLHREINKEELLSQFLPGDLLVINNTQVLKRRIFAKDLEIVFIRRLELRCWEVLFPAKKFQINDEVDLPGQVVMKLIEKGRPQKVELSQEIDENYFYKWGELALPPYIQQCRGSRHTVEKDESWYQTHWAAVPGSLAAPTASLHFDQSDFLLLKEKNVLVEQITLHVGLGTFLPIKVEKLDEHSMHFEFVEVSRELMEIIVATKSRGGRIWALGTTVARALESVSQGMLPIVNQKYIGETNLFIQPGFKWRIVDFLLTNFHQPKSTLLALVASFSGLDKVKDAYHFAIEKKFRMLSYGDLSVWQR